MVVVSEGAEDEGSGLRSADVGGVSFVVGSSSALSAMDSICCCPVAAATGPGIKNFGAPEAAVGLTAGTDGDWNRLAGLPPPLLKVSTYLRKILKVK